MYFLVYYDIVVLIIMKYDNDTTYTNSYITDYLCSQSKTIPSYISGSDVYTRKKSTGIRATFSSDLLPQCSFIAVRISFTSYWAYFLVS